MDNKAKMREIYQFFKENKDNLFTNKNDDIAYHVIFIDKSSGDDKAKLLNTGASESEDAILMLMYHIDSIRRGMGKEVNADSAAEWMKFISFMYLSTLGNPLYQMIDGRDFSSTTITMPDY